LLVLASQLAATAPAESSVALSQHGKVIRIELRNHTTDVWPLYTESSPNIEPFVYVLTPSGKAFGTMLPPTPSVPANTWPRLEPRGERTMELGVDALLGVHREAGEFRVYLKYPKVRSNVLRVKVEPADFWPLMPERGFFEPPTTRPVTLGPGTDPRRYYVQHLEYVWEGVIYPLTSHYFKNERQAGELTRLFSEAGSLLKTAIRRFGKDAVAAADGGILMPGPATLDAVANSRVEYNEYFDEAKLVGAPAFFDQPVTLRGPWGWQLDLDAIYCKDGRPHPWTAEYRRILATAQENLEDGQFESAEALAAWLRDREAALRRDAQKR
jgi:hypothetical protein